MITITLIKDIIQDWNNSQYVYFDYGVRMEIKLSHRLFELFLMVFSIAIIFIFTIPYDIISLIVKETIKIIR